MLAPGCTNLSATAEETHQCMHGCMNLSATAEVITFLSAINLGWNREATQNLSWRSKQQLAAAVHLFSQQLLCK